MSKSSPVALAVFATVALLACGSVAHAQVTSVRQIEGADPQRDFKAAIARGDLRFVAVNGFVGGMVPGTDQSGTDRALIAAHGKSTIHGCRLEPCFS